MDPRYISPKTGSGNEFTSHPAWVELEFGPNVEEEYGLLIGMLRLSSGRNIVPLPGIKTISETFFLTFLLSRAFFILHLLSFFFQLFNVLFSRCFRISLFYIRLETFARLGRFPFFQFKSFVISWSSRIDFAVISLT